MSNNEDVNKITVFDYVEENATEAEFLMDLLSEVSLNQLTSNITLLSDLKKRMLISLDTGLQKTSIMASLALLASIKIKGKIPLMIIPPEANHNIPKIRRWVHPKKVTVLDSESGVDGRLPNYKQILLQKTDILVISPRLLYSKDFTNIWVSFLKELVSTLIMDEVHLSSNEETQGGYMLRYMTTQIDAVHLLTATPGRTPEEFEFLLSMVDGNYISVTRAMLDIEGEFFVRYRTTDVDSIPESLLDEEEYNRLHKFRKSPHKNNPMLKQLVSRTVGYVRQQQKILIYSRFLNAQKMLAQELRSVGLEVGVINSNTTREAQDKAAQCQVVISTKTAAIDVPASVLLCWGWTVDIVQLVGRTNRTYNKQDLILDLDLLGFEEELLNKHIEMLHEMAILTDKSTSLFSALAREVQYG